MNTQSSFTPATTAGSKSHLGYFAPGTTQHTAREVETWRAGRKVLARAILLLVGVIGAATCLCLVYFQWISIADARYVKGGLNAATTLIQFALQSSLVSIISAHGVYTRTSLLRVLGMVGNVNLLDAIGAGDVLLASTVALDAAFVLGMSYAAGGVIGTTNSTIMELYAGSCDPQLGDNPSSNQRAFNWTGTGQVAGVGTLMFEVLKGGGAESDPMRNIGNIPSPSQADVLEVGVYTASAACEAILDITAFGANYTAVAQPIGGGYYANELYLPIRIQRAESGGGGLFVKYGLLTAEATGQTYPAIEQNTTKFIIQQYSIQDQSLTPTHTKLGSAARNGNGGNTTVQFGSVTLGTQVAYVEQFACDVRLSLNTCRMSRLGGVDECVPSPSAMQFGDLAYAMMTDNLGSIGHYVDNAPLLAVTYWGRGSNNSNTADDGTYTRERYISVDHLERQMARMLVNLAYAYGDVAPCARRSWVHKPRTGLIHPNLPIFVTMVGISIVLFLAYAIAVLAKLPAYGILASGLDIARTVAQSDYLQDTTQGKCAEPDVNPQVALSFTPVYGGPGHIHFVPPGQAEPWQKGRAYAGQQTRSKAPLTQLPSAMTKE